ncbi:penicillin-binding protein 1A [Caenimonas koreensis]|uniref:penicillin-binding protein 1A n=1 Tax=Caenimonas koreensis TaxID=367474 RepID=UPI00378473CF
MHPAAERALSLLREKSTLLWQSIQRHPVRTALVAPALVLLYVLVLIPFTPGIGDLRKGKAETPAVVLSADNVVLAEFRRVNRQWVPLAKISPHVVNALIATEDKRFYEHHGIDFVRTGGALLRTLGGNRQGGSTITQQLARNMYPEDIGRAVSINRKVKEAITAVKIEAVYTKSEILETYLNTVPFLYNAFGIEMAARTYFDKSADKLDILESATLIGMLKGNSVYNPVLNPERARDRRNVVLAQMVKAGKLDAKRLDSLAARPLVTDFERQKEPIGVAPHVAQFVRQWLIGWADRRGYNIYADGLVIKTTINSRHQKAANQAVLRNMNNLQALADGQRKRGEEKRVLQTGFMALDPRNGRILAWVGSRDFATEQFDHVVMARRQPGSTFKPFVYGAAFMGGFGPSDTFVDQAVSYRMKGGDVWTPTDGTPATGDSMTLRDALALSKNTVTAQLMQRVGPQRVVDLAQAMGVRQSKLEAVPSLALGTSPVTLKEMVTAYATIANEGAYNEPFLVTRVEDRKGVVLEQFALPLASEGMPRPSALTLVDVMRGVVDKGTGSAIRTRYGIQADVAGKTGTTQDNSDGWFILMHPQLVAGAWVGYNDNTVNMGAWGQGARSALPIIGDYFQQSLRYKWIDSQVEFAIPRPRPEPPPVRLPDPVDVVRGFLDRLFRGR